MQKAVFEKFFGQVEAFPVHLAGPPGLQLSRMPFARPGEWHGNRPARPDECHNSELSDKAIMSLQVNVTGIKKENAIFAE